jgi:hypothetical protein
MSTTMDEEMDLIVEKMIMINDSEGCSWGRTKEVSEGNLWILKPRQPLG